jgi:hypothetical protein
MIKIFHLTIGILCCLSCNQAPKKVAQNSNTKDTVRLSATNVQPKIVFETKQFAEQLLNGTAKASDNEPTFACMDSFFAKNRQTRDFYWQVFEKIAHKSDGALSEAVSVYIQKYVEAYPIEFAHRYESSSQEFKTECIFHAASEHAISKENAPIQEVEKYYEDIIRQKCKNATPNEIKVLNDFVKAVLKDFKKMNDE